MKCPKCNGTGVESSPNSKLYSYGERIFRVVQGSITCANECPFCKGNKELDWIECIFGVDLSSREKMIVKILAEALEKLPRNFKK